MKTVAVTGAAGGMGSAICQMLQENGYAVYGLDVRPVEMPGVTGISCDLTDPQSVERAGEEIQKNSGRLDGIIHAAGIYDLYSLTEIDETRFRRIFEINVFGVYRVNRVLTPLMGQGGRVTIVTSELGPIKPLPFTGIYAVTKGALEKYAYSLRNELMLRGISVSVIRPGAVDTGLLNVSTAALDRFCRNTRYYQPNAKRFYDIVSRVEARAVPPRKIAELALRSMEAKRPKYVYNINRNILLRLMAALPDRMQTAILKCILH